MTRARIAPAPRRTEEVWRALKTQVDPEAFEKMRGAVSFPFRPGEHKRIAVKVVDFRGNEVMRVMPLEEARHGSQPIA